MTTGMHMQVRLRHMGSRMHMHTGAYVALHSRPHDDHKHDARREEVEEQPEPRARSFLPTQLSGRTDAGYEHDKYEHVRLSRQHQKNTCVALYARHHETCT